MTSEYDKLVKLGHLRELLEKLDYELAGEDISESSELQSVVSMIEKAEAKIEKEIAEQKEKDKLDAYVYMIVQKVKNYRKEEVILNILNECFSTYEEAVRYIGGHYRAKRSKLYRETSWQLGRRFENDDFIYEIHKVAVVSKYDYDNDRIIYREGVKE